MKEGISVVDIDRNIDRVISLIVNRDINEYVRKFDADLVKRLADKGYNHFLVDVCSLLVSTTHKRFGHAVTNGDQYRFSSTNYLYRFLLYKED